MRDEELTSLPFITQTKKKAALPPQSYNLNMTKGSFSLLLLLVKGGESGKFVKEGVDLAYSDLELLLCCF